jgi:UDP-N-acetylglucosamine 4-epimerase
LEVTGHAMHGPFRAGDVRHSEADIGKAVRMLGYAPTHDIAAGISQALHWYLAEG